MPEEGGIRFSDRDRIEKYISLAEAAKLSGYSHEYLRLRVRQGKLKAVKFGRNWVTTAEWVHDYISTAEQYQMQVQQSRAEKQEAQAPGEKSLGEYQKRIKESIERLNYEFSDLSDVSLGNKYRDREFRNGESRLTKAEFDRLPGVKPGGRMTPGVNRQLLNLVKQSLFGHFRKISLGAAPLVLGLLFILAGYALFNSSFLSKGSSVILSEAKDLKAQILRLRPQDDGWAQVLRQVKLGFGLWAQNDKVVAASNAAEAVNLFGDSTEKVLGSMNVSLESFGESVWEESSSFAMSAASGVIESFREFDEFAALVGDSTFEFFYSPEHSTLALIEDAFKAGEFLGGSIASNATAAEKTIQGAVILSTDAFYNVLLDTELLALKIKDSVFSASLAASNAASNAAAAAATAFDAAQLRQKDLADYISYLKGEAENIKHGVAVAYKRADSKVAEAIVRAYVKTLSFLLPDEFLVLAPEEIVPVRSLKELAEARERIQKEQ